LPLVDKILKRIAGWRGKLISLAARAVLLKTCLASIHVYILSFLKFPKWAIKLLNTQMGIAYGIMLMEIVNITYPIGSLSLCVRSLEVGVF
jgi:hypothetical protein